MGKKFNNKNFNLEDADYLVKAEKLADLSNHDMISEKEGLDILENFLDDYFETGNEKIIEAIVRFKWTRNPKKTSDTITDVLSKRKQISRKEISSVKKLMEEMQRRFGDDLLEVYFSEEKSNGKTIISLLINYYGIISELEMLYFDLVE